MLHGWVPSDSTLLVFKYIGSTFAAAYGVYATVTDFKEEKQGKKVLSKKGVWGITLLLFSILLNTSSDAFRDLHDRAKADEEKKAQAKAVADQKQVSDNLSAELNLTRQLNADLNKVNKELRQTSVTAGLALKEASRASDPFSRADINKFTVGFRIPTNELAIQEYLKRIRAEAYLNKSGQIVEPEPGELLIFTPNSGGFPAFDRPSELTLAMRAHLSAVKLTFQRKGIARDLTRIPDLLLQEVEGPSLEGWMLCGPESSVAYEVPRSDNRNDVIGLKFLCQGTKINWTDRSGGFRSYQDFEGATVTVELSSSGRNALTNYVLSDILMMTAQDRKIELSQPAVCVPRDTTVLSGPRVDCLGILRVR
jgi:hypothetical protein